MQGLGVALTALRQCMVFGTTVLRRRMLVSLEIPNRDRAYEWVLAWMAQQQSSVRTSGWTRSHQLSVETRFQQHKNGSSSVLFDLVAGPGIHWMKYRGAWMQVRNIRLIHLAKNRIYISC